jgi:hypothetical protein
MEFKSWHDIQDWCKEHGFDKLAKRMQLNNDCWMSSGEFGRDQVYICDNLRFCEVEDREAVAQALQDGDELIELGLI